MQPMTIAVTKKINPVWITLHDNLNINHCTPKTNAYKCTHTSTSQTKLVPHRSAIQQFMQIPTISVMHDPSASGLLKDRCAT